MKRYSVHLASGTPDLLGPRFAGRYNSAAKAFRIAQHIADHYGVVTQTAKDERNIIATLTPPASLAENERSEADHQADQDDPPSSPSLPWQPGILKAVVLGREHGTNAAEWWIQDALTNSPSARQVAQDIQQGIEEGDPEVLDRLPHADLSGEWADSWSPMRLWGECYDNPYEEPYADQDTRVQMLQDLCDAYEESFSEAVNTTISSALQRELEPTEATDGTEVEN